VERDEELDRRHLPDRRHLSSDEKKFRRGLYVMLVTLGILAASSIIYARDAQRDAKKQVQDAQELARQANHKNDVLLEQLKILTAELQRLDRLSSSEFSNANEERHRLLRRIDALETFILILLENSSDPDERRAAREFRNRDASPSPSPRGRHTPSPTPSPSPTCILIARVCIPYPEITVQPMPQPTPMPAPQPTQ
jgi:hypothetical protein